MKMRRFLKLFLAFALCLSLIAPSIVVFAAGYSEAQLTSRIDGIISWKKSVLNTADDEIIGGALLSQAGSSRADWFVFGLIKSGKSYDYSAYLAKLNSIAQSYYSSASTASTTDKLRVALLIDACSGNPQSLGSGAHNLLADCTYNCKDLGNVSIFEYIYALLLLDSRSYSIPTGSINTRRSIIDGLLDCELSGGGFAVIGSAADVDTTAAVIQALAPYYSAHADVKAVIDRSLALISKTQLGSGGFKSFSTENCESTAQVIVALCSLGLNPQSEAGFIKNGNSAVDALLGFCTDSGGFSHTPAGAADAMASAQALYALAALKRQINALPALFRYTSGVPSVELPSTTAPTAAPTTTKAPRVNRVTTTKRPTTAKSTTTTAPTTVPKATTTKAITTAKTITTAAAASTTAAAKAPSAAVTMPPTSASTELSAVMQADKSTSAALSNASTSETEASTTAVQASSASMTDAVTFASAALTESTDFSPSDRASPLNAAAQKKHGKMRGIVIAAGVFFVAAAFAATLTVKKRRSK